MRRPRPLGSTGLYTHPGGLPNAAGTASVIPDSGEGEGKNDISSRCAGMSPHPQQLPMSSSPSQPLPQPRVAEGGHGHLDTLRDRDELINPSYLSFDSCHDFIKGISSFEQQQPRSTPAQECSHVAACRDSNTPAPQAFSSTRWSDPSEAQGDPSRTAAQDRQSTNVSVLGIRNDAVTDGPSATALRPVKGEESKMFVSGNVNECYDRWLTSLALREAGSAGVLVPSPLPEPMPPVESVGGSRFVRLCGGGGITSQSSQATAAVAPLPDTVVTWHRSTTRDSYWLPVNTSSTDGNSSGFHSNSAERCAVPQPRAIQRRPPCSPLDTTLAPHEPPNASLTTAGLPPPSLPDMSYSTRVPVGQPSSYLSPLLAAEEDEAAVWVKGSMETQDTTTMVPLHSPTGDLICSSGSTVFYAETKAPLGGATPVSQPDTTVQWIKNGPCEMQQRRDRAVPPQPAQAGSSSLVPTSIQFPPTATTSPNTPPTQPLSCAVLPKTPTRPHHHGTLASPEPTSRTAPVATFSSFTSTTTTTTTTTVKASAATALNTRDNKHCRVLPVLPSQAPDALVQLYGTDTRQAAAATSVLEAVQRTNKVRGRRPLSPQNLVLQGGVVKPMVSTVVGSSSSNNASGTTPTLCPLIFLPHPSSATILLPSTLPAKMLPTGKWPSFSRPQVGGSNTSSNSLYHRASRKAVVVKSTTITTTTTTIATLSGESTDFIHSAVSNPGLSVSNTITNRHVSSAEETSASSLALQPHMLSMRWNRGSETGFEGISLLSLVDIGLSPNMLTPHKPRSSLHTFEERSAAGLPLELQHLPAFEAAARSAASSRAASVQAPDNEHVPAEAEGPLSDPHVKALSHMECAAQPQPNLLREGSSFYQKSLIEVANKMADLPLSPLSAKARSSFTEQPSSTKTLLEKHSGKDVEDTHARK